GIRDATVTGFRRVLFRSLAEDERRWEGRIGPDPTRVDPELGERAPDIHAEPVIADLRDDRGAPPEARGGDRDVGGAATQGLRERSEERRVGKGGGARWEG